MNDEDLKNHMTALYEGYKHQLTQLVAGLQQMLVQKDQLSENIPLLETEIEAVETKIEQLKKYLSIEEEE
ncbi:hypothetical protein N9X64_00485 [bacterium]|nr:hypothetical protein [bacterium]